MTLLTPPLLRVELSTSQAECPGQYIHSRRSEGLRLYKTSPIILVHLTTKVKRVVNDRLLASRAMPNGVTVQIVSDRNIS